MIEKIQVNVINFKKVILYALITFLLIFLGAQIGVKYVNGKNIFMYAIALCVIVFSLLIYVINKNTFLTSFSFSPDKLLIKNTKDHEISIKITEISNYAIYYMVIKKWGYLLRIRKNNINFYFYITPMKFTKIEAVDHENYIRLKEAIEKFTHKPPTKMGVDWLILLIVCFPFLIILGILISVIILY